MIVGILKEIKVAENSVCMTPAGVEVISENGHVVLVETEAGMGSGFDDDAYVMPVPRLLRRRKRSIAGPKWSCTSKSPSPPNTP